MSKPALWRQLDAGPVEIAVSVDTSGIGLRDGADRNVDVLMLTQNTSDWERRLSDETTNLPGDGLLSQVGRTFGLSPCLILAPLWVPKAG